MEITPDETDTLQQFVYDHHKQEFDVTQVIARKG